MRIDPLPKVAHIIADGMSDPYARQLSPFGHAPQSSGADRQYLGRFFDVDQFDRLSVVMRIHLPLPDQAPEERAVTAAT